MYRTNSAIWTGLHCKLEKSMKNLQRWSALFAVLLCACCLAACSEPGQPQAYESASIVPVSKPEQDENGFPNLTISADMKSLSGTSGQDMPYLVCEAGETPREFAPSELFMELVQRDYPVLPEKTDLYITFYGEAPNRIMVEDSVLNEGMAFGTSFEIDGTVQWTQKQGLEPDADGEFRYHLYKLDDGLHPFPPDAEEQLRGVVLTCEWDNRVCGYHFVFRLKLEKE